MKIMNKKHKFIFDMDGTLYPFDKGKIRHLENLNFILICGRVFVVLLWLKEKSVWITQF